MAAEPDAGDQADQNEENRDECLAEAAHEETGTAGRAVRAEWTGDPSGEGSHGPLGVLRTALGLRGR
jgi:hypothetical protein